ncbi:hypothetical protein [Oligella sp. MSHR50489EDL]
MIITQSILTQPVGIYINRRMRLTPSANSTQATLRASVRFIP